MATTFKFGGGNWAVKDGYVLAYNDENNNFKPLPFDFTRASSATRVNKQGLVETVPSGKPRVDFLDNTSGHLLLEPSRTNLMPTSEDFNGADWNRAALTIDSDDAISPYGTSTADKITFTGSGTLRTWNTFTFTNAYTYSIFVKKGNSRYVTLRSFAFTTSAIIGFDLDSVTAQTGGVIKQYPNDWFRLSISKDVSSDADKNGYFYFYLPNSLGSTTSVNGNYAYIFGNQIEEGSYATSYIPTEGSSVTRVAETNSQTLITDVLDTDYNTGAMYAEFKLGQDSITRFMSIIGTFWTTTSVRMELTPNASFIGEVVQSGVGSSITAVSAVGITSGDVVKCAISWNNGTLKIALNGTVSTGTCPVMTTRPTDLYLNLLGTFSGTGQNEKNEFRDIKLYDTALTDTELQNLTS